MKKAFTLIEVLISVFLMTIVLLMIGASIDIFLRQMHINRTGVEEAQLARAVLDTIARDIRSVVVALREEELEIDDETLTMLFSLYGEDAGAYLPGETETETETGESTSSVVESEEAYGVMPGIYGDVEWLQVDTTKLPRGEMYGSRQVRSGSSVLGDRLSPTKTILYYLGEDTGQITNAEDPRYDPDRMVGSLGRSLDTSAVRYGLFRRQKDRMVSQYAFNEGLETEYEQYDEPLAPEVESIEFAYFDPEETQSGQSGEAKGDWVEYWDMDERGYLPLAIRITVAIRKQAVSRSMFSGWGNTEETDSRVVYSLVVPIPVTVDVPVQEESEEEAVP